MSTILSELNTGASWSYPAGQGSGMVWMGTRPCTEDDLQALYDEMGQVGVQESTLCGRYQKPWISDWYEGVDPESRPGGQGSSPYYHQFTGSGVTFVMDGEEIWYYNYQGDYVKDIPDQGYHAVYDGDGYVNYEGPAPGSEAERRKGDETYWLDEADQLMRITVKGQMIAGGTKGLGLAIIRRLADG